MFHYGKYTLINESVVLVRHYRFLTVYNVSCAGTAVVKAPERPDVLDTALLHPGRFDQQATVMTWMAVLRSSACTHAVRPSGPMLT